LYLVCTTSRVAATAKTTGIKLGNAAAPRDFEGNEKAGQNGHQSRKLAVPNELPSHFDHQAELR
jgi:hypothetical protein